MTAYFEYLNRRGHIVGWSDDFSWTDDKDITERAYNIINHSREIYTVIARGAKTDLEVGRWGM
jgi:hypothetical protein